MSYRILTLSNLSIARTRYMKTLSHSWDHSFKWLTFSPDGIQDLKVSLAMVVLAVSKSPLTHSVVTLELILIPVITSSLALVKLRSTRCFNWLHVGPSSMSLKKLKQLLMATMHWLSKTLETGKPFTVRLDLKVWLSWRLDGAPRSEMATLHMLVRIPQARVTSLVSA